MDVERTPIPINTDLADDHYDHQDVSVDGEPREGDDPPKTATAPTATAPKVVKTNEE